MDLEGSPATFVVPHWTDDLGRTGRHLRAAIDGIVAQTDTNWRIVLVDDASPDPAVPGHLRALGTELAEWLHVILRPVNEGPGACRNAGVRWAGEQRSPIVLFNDADDVSDPERLATVRRVFAERPGTGVVYSTFRVIDQDGRELAPDEVTASVAEVLEQHRADPPQGDDVWIAIGTTTGYVNHTSSTAVRTSLALELPFPPERVSEDAHTWFRYSAGGGRFVYVDRPLSSYRTTTDTAGSASRSREGGKEGFYATKARVDTAGFTEAMELARARGTVDAARCEELLVAFHRRLAVTFAREGLPDLADEQERLAASIRPSS